ncbi:MAG: amidohydrolase family protein, partial [Allomuricauda sp.]
LLHVTPEQAVFELLQIGHAKVVSFNMALEDIHNFMQQDWVVTGSDGNTGHPRKYGSFPRKYAKYVKQDSIISLAKFINGSTHKTAEIFKIPQRGAIKEGYCADIIIFDPDKFEDRAGYTDAFLYAKGLEYSIINGRMSVEKGQYTDQLNGSVLLKQQALK